MEKCQDMSECLWAGGSTRGKEMTPPFVCFPIKRQCRWEKTHKKKQLTWNLFSSNNHIFVTSNI